MSQNYFSSAPQSLFALFLLHSPLWVPSKNLLEQKGHAAWLLHMYVPWISDLISSMSLALFLSLAGHLGVHHLNSLWSLLPNPCSFMDQLDSQSKWPINSLPACRDSLNFNPGMHLLICRGLESLGYHLLLSMFRVF